MLEQFSELRKCDLPISVPVQLLHQRLGLGCVHVPELAQLSNSDVATAILVYGLESKYSELSTS